MSYSFAFYCRCGAGWRGTVPKIIILQQMESIWDEAHSDPGCAACDAATARRTRAKVERLQADGREA